MHEDYYYNRLTYFDTDARRVGWKSVEAQQIRFEKLGQVITGESFVVHDVGCGIGDFALFLQEHLKVPFQYVGYDILPDMITEARRKYEKWENVRFEQIEVATQIEKADYTIACGIFNLRYGYSDEQWLAYLLETVTTMNQKSSKGFAFNVLTKYTATTDRNIDLYYADVCFLFDYCKQNFSENVALLHDYGYEDCTILVRK